MIITEMGPDWVGSALNPVGPEEVRDDVLYVCEQCKSDGEEFKVPADEVGVVVMQQHLEDHGFKLAIEFHPCPECGMTIGCKLGQPPAGCSEHQ